MLQRMNDPPELLTSAEAAEYLRTSANMMAHWRARGMGPVYLRLNGKGRILYRRSDLLEWLKAGERRPA